MNLIDFEIEHFSFVIKVLKLIYFSPEYSIHLIIKTTRRFYYFLGGRLVLGEGIISHDGQEAIATLTSESHPEGTLLCMCRLHGLKHANSKNLTSRLAEENGIETDAKRMVQARQDGGKVRSCVQALFMHAPALHCRRCSRD